MCGGGRVADYRCLGKSPWSQVNRFQHAGEGTVSRLGNLSHKVESMEGNLSWGPELSQMEAGGEWKPG